jgi:hypothetical protein
MGPLGWDERYLEETAGKAGNRPESETGKMSFEKPDAIKYG